MSPLRSMNTASSGSSFRDRLPEHSVRMLFGEGARDLKVSPANVKTDCVAGHCLEEKTNMRFIQAEREREKDDRIPMIRGSRHVMSNHVVP